MVKNITAFTLTFLLIASEKMEAIVSRELFQEGEQLYEAKNFQDALHIYEKINNKGPGTWFNVSACCYALQDYPLAIVAAIRAQKGASSRLLEKIDKGIESAYGKLNKPYSSHEHSSRFAQWALSFSPLFIQLLFLLSWYLLWFLVFKKRKVTFVSFFLGLLLSLCFLFGLILLVHYYSSVYKRGITVKDTRIVVGPHEHYDILQEIPLLKEVYIKEQRDKWYKITVDGCTGWIRADSVELL